MWRQKGRGSLQTQGDGVGGRSLTPLTCPGKPYKLGTGSLHTVNSRASSGILGKTRRPYPLKTVPAPSRDICRAPAMLGWFWALHSQGQWQREREMAGFRVRGRGSEHPGRALHPTQGQEGSQEGDSGVVPAGLAGQRDRQSGKGSCHTVQTACVQQGGFWKM